MRDEVKILSVCDQVRETAFALHSYLRNGYLEKIYENGMFNRLRKLGLQVERQRPLEVFDEDSTLLGEYAVDLFVEESLIIELKACKALADEHIAQVLGYLRASRIRDALLINFGGAKLEVKKLIL